MGILFQTRNWTSSSTTTSNIAWGGGMRVKIRKNRCFNLE